MVDERLVWIDEERCTGCGACVEACPVAAITLVGGIARVDAETCTGCEACIVVCPEDAVQPVVQGEIVPAQEGPVPAVRRPSPLAETAGAAMAVAGVGLLARVAQVLARTVEHWLAQPSTAMRPSSGTAAPSMLEGGRAPGRGRRARRRRRGR
jgi:Fe-S-cluster-containing hydrogenase component 2